jgi:hypothetical protein
MEASVEPYLSEGGEASTPSSLDVLILYEDYGTGLRAKHSLDFLPAQLPAHAKWSTKLWRSELLSDPVLSEQAAMEAAAADVIILSVHGQSALPEEVRAWLNRWLNQKARRPYALGVLLDAGDVSQGSENPVVAYLQQVALVAGVDLFYGFSEAPLRELDPAMAEINERAHYSSAVIEDMLKRAQPHQRWGINE